MRNQRSLARYLAASLLLLGCGAARAQTLADRIHHYIPEKTNHLAAVHDGAGTMDYGPLMDTTTLSTNLIFLHRGVIAPHSGIGQHFHNHCEEMFVILDGEAQFTVNGRTSLLKGPVGAPDRMGSAHGIYNPTDKPVAWMNINVGTSKVYDAFNLGDDRVGAPLDKVPQFVTLKMDKALLKPAAGETGVLRYRALGPSVFYTPWAYVDHVLVAPGGVIAPAIVPGVSEAYYVMSGEGSVTVEGETAAIRKGDAIPVDVGQRRGFKSGAEPLDLLVVGVAKDMATKNSFLADPKNAN